MAPSVTQQDSRLGEVDRDRGRRARVPSVPGVSLREAGLRDEGPFDLGSFRTRMLTREGFKCDRSRCRSLLTHLGETIRNNLAQLLSYKDLRALLDRYGAGIQAAHRRDMSRSYFKFRPAGDFKAPPCRARLDPQPQHLILEAIAEIVPHVRRSEQVVEHVRMRIAQQICGDLSGEWRTQGPSPRTTRWDLAFQQSLKRDTKSDHTGLRPRPANGRTVQHRSIADHSRDGWIRATAFVLLATPETRIYVRMIVERMFATLPVLSHLEIAREVSRSRHSDRFLDQADTRHSSLTAFVVFLSRSAAVSSSYRAFPVPAFPCKPGSSSRSRSRWP